jgi:hypothetical protein
LVVLVFALLLGACQAETQDPSELTPAKAAEAGGLLRDYDSARSGGNWTVAESLAEQLHKRFPDSAQAASVDASLADVQRQADAQRDAHRLEGLWTYQAIAVGKGVQRSASIDSRTVKVEEGELAPAADGQLVLRDHPAWGRSAYLLLAEKDFRCGKPCRLKLRFDEGADADWAGKQADSGKGPALFIEDEARFIDALGTAKLVRITLPPGSGRIGSLAFEIGGFRRERFESGK